MCNKAQTSLLLKTWTWLAKNGQSPVIAATFVSCKILLVKIKKLCHIHLIKTFFESAVLFHPDVQSSRYSRWCWYYLFLTTEETNIKQVRIFGKTLHFTFSQVFTTYHTKKDIFNVYFIILKYTLCPTNILKFSSWRLWGEWANCIHSF